MDTHSILWTISDAIFLGARDFSPAVLRHAGEVGGLRLASGNELRVTGAQACEVIFFGREVQVLLVVQREALGRRM